MKSDLLALTSRAFSDIVAVGEQARTSYVKRSVKSAIARIKSLEEEILTREPEDCGDCAHLKDGKCVKVSHCEKCVTVDEYWDCVCDDKFIHPRHHEYCPDCLAKRDECPDSHKIEVDSGLYFWKESSNPEIERLRHELAETRKENGNLFDRIRMMAQEVIGLEDDLNKGMNNG